MVLITARPGWQIAMISWQLGLAKETSTKQQKRSIAWCIFTEWSIPCTCNVVISQVICSDFEGYILWWRSVWRILQYPTVFPWFRMYLILWRNQSGLVYDNFFWYISHVCFLQMAMTRLRIKKWLCHQFIRHFFYRIPFVRCLIRWSYVVFPCHILWYISK